MQSSVGERLLQKGWSEEKIEAVNKRYNRSIRLREVVIPLAEQDQKVREELLDERGRNIFQKGLKLYKEKNEQFESAISSRLVGKKSLGFGKVLTEKEAKR